MLDAHVNLRYSCVLRRVMNLWGHHDSEIIDDGTIDWGDAGDLGVVAAGPEAAEAPFVHAGAGGAVGGYSLTGFLWR